MFKSSNNDLMEGAVGRALGAVPPARVKNSSIAVRHANASDDRALSVNEFARLACVLTQHEDSNQALLDSQLNLTRAQLDQSERKNDICSLKIAPLFNSPDISVGFNPCIDLPRVSANAALFSIRSGS
jgi:hypothetical protein